VLSAAPVDVPTDLAVVGATWTAGSPGDTPQARVRTEGRWGPWQDLEVDEDHGPDAGRPEAEGARRGSAPLVVTAAEQVEVRIVSSDASLPKDARVEVVDPGASPADAPAASGPPAAASAAAAKPTIYSRAQWGADESKRTGSPSYGQVQLGFVHHTDGSNTYSAEQVPGIIRGIYTYHVSGQGWSDIGYNYLVDRFGRIWEGRYGGIDKAVIGAQTKNFNSWSTGASVLGNYESTAVPSAVTSSLARLFAWKLSLAGVPATGRVAANGKTFNRISGHRDGFQTACPGASLYARLPSIRSSATSLQGSLASTPVARDVDRNSQPDVVTLPAAPGTQGALRLSRGHNVKPVRSWTRIGSGWNGLTLVTMTPDVSGDGKPDVLGVEPGGGRLRIYQGDGRGGFLERTTFGTWWNLFRELVPAGDRTGDGHNDLLGITKSGELRLYPGQGNGVFSASRLLDSGWGSYRGLVSMGDLTGDGQPDVLATSSANGEQRMFAGTADGGLEAGVLWGRSWGSLTATDGGGDLDGDGNPDLLAREPSGRMRTYYSSSRGTWERWNYWGSGWHELNGLSSGVDFNGDGRVDILGVYPETYNGALLLYPGTGARDLADTEALDPVPGADLARIAGDIDGDGYADMVVRVPARRSLEVLRGRGNGRFNAPVMMGTGWNEFTMIEPVADMNRDGVPDVVARTSTGEVWLYPMTRSLRFLPRFRIASGWGGMVSIAGAGSFNDDANGDIVALTSTKSLVLYRGAGAGSTLLDQSVLKSGQSDLTRIVGVDDFNGDGYRDVMAAGTSGRLWLYAGTRTGTLEASRQSVHTNQGAGHVIG
jgi:hypothetical protein